MNPSGLHYDVINEIKAMLVWKHHGFPASLRSFQTVRDQRQDFELLAVNTQLATSPMNRSNVAWVPVAVVWRTFRT